MAKQVKRDANVPVLEFEIEGTRYRVKVANPGEVVKCEYNPKHSWVPTRTASLIVVMLSPHGTEETEHDIFNASTWGWFARLMTDRSIPIKLLSKTDYDLHEESK